MKVRSQLTNLSFYLTVRDTYMSYGYLHNSKVYVEVCPFGPSLRPKITNGPLGVCELWHRKAMVVIGIVCLFFIWVRFADILFFPVAKGASGARLNFSKSSTSKVMSSNESFRLVIELYSTLYYSELPDFIVFFSH